MKILILIVDLVKNNCKSLTLNKDSHIASVIKGITWRFVGTIDTILISYLIIGDMPKAMSIGGIEVITKVSLYYIHERIWLRIQKRNEK